MDLPMCGSPRFCFNSLYTPLWQRVLLILIVLMVLTACESGDATVQPYHHAVASKSLILKENFTIERRFVGQVKALSRLI